MTRIWRLLRSRKLAIWVIAGIVTYAALATTVSDGEWSVPYRNPVFLVLAGLLALSTAACAWERTKVAVTAMRVRAPSEQVLERLRQQPKLAIPVPADGDALRYAEVALAGLRLRTVRYGDSIEAFSGRIGTLGSSLFHWALALLFVVICLGQLTRYEGLMGIVSGSAKPDLPESYGLLETGPLVGSLSGLQFAVPRIESSYTANGLEQGVTPFVEIRSEDGLRVLESGYAHPNHPIRYGRLLVHRSADGLGAVFRVIAPGGQQATNEVLLDYADNGEVQPQSFGVGDENGATIVTVEVGLDEGSTPEAPLTSIRAVAADGSGETVQGALGVGDRTEIPGGLTLEVMRLTRYARLSIASDWSVYWIYALFVLAIVGLAFALFFPLKRVRILLVDTAGGTHLHVAVRHGRGDPHFPDRVENALRAALQHREESA